ncbi:hypothetical protein JCM9534A_59400 [Catenuloplanes indicus JCM 9534]|uniref:LytR/CpsA/Psr regulator C-terminal domain-containing protein n=2 Tax=Catenuloplanes indicus TaxID=137267 RepID=A0AAE4B2R3_9ACTN|nr:hypothetical protein [Catenuloplanes indicus]
MSYARMRALIVLSVLTVAAIVFVAVALVQDTQTEATTVEECPEGYVLANVALPEPKDVKLKVFNAAGQNGLGARVSTDFSNRKFQVEKPENSDRTSDDVAILRYGPKTVGAAHLLRAYFLDNALTEYDEGRDSDIVDVVIGTGFEQLATTTEVNQSLVELGQAEVPPGACAA